MSDTTIERRKSPGRRLSDFAVMKKIELLGTKTSCATFEIDNEDRIVLTDDMFVKITGREDYDFVWTDLFENSNEIKENWINCKNKTDIFSITAHMNSRFYSITISRVVDNVDNFVGVIQDITNKKHLIDELNKLRMSND
ncbi:MAG: hypothetical protein WC284_07800 [Candidimonas sp.]